MVLLLTKAVLFCFFFHLSAKNRFSLLGSPHGQEQTGSSVSSSRPATPTHWPLCGILRWGLGGQGPFLPFSWLVPQPLAVKEPACRSPAVASRAGVGNEEAAQAVLSRRVLTVCTLGLLVRMGIQFGCHFSRACALRQRP